MGLGLATCAGAGFGRATWAGMGLGRAAGACGRAAWPGAAIEGVRLNEGLAPACAAPPGRAPPARPPRWAQAGSPIERERQTAIRRPVVVFITGGSPAGWVWWWGGRIAAGAASVPG